MNSDFTSALPEKERQSLEKLLDKDENLLYIAKIYKFNRFDWKQERLLLITDKHIYNFRKKSLKRKISLNQVEGITKSIVEGSLEFVIHVPTEYDYRYASEKRETILKTIKEAYHKLRKRNLPIYHVIIPMLRDFTTTKKDRKKNIFRMPPSSFRAKAEDIAEEKDSHSSSSTHISTGESMHSSQEYVVVDDVHDQEEKEIISDTTDTTRRSSTLYCKKVENKEVALQDFNIVKVLGQGTFGKVFLVEKAGTKDLYAMKALRKDVLIDYDQIESTKLEKEILLRANHPFIVGMEFVFQTETKIYFVMRFVRGGELYMHLTKARRFPEQRAKFYSAIIGLAIGHLHKQNIVYRDIKPENILMEEDGYVCLADFGLAKIVTPEAPAMSFCGTPEYLAPEILTGEGHGPPVDWWCLGVLIYEMIFGKPPFYHKNVNMMYEQIRKYAVPFYSKDPIPISAECKDLLTRLLDKNQKTRLGSKGDIDEIMAHPFFSDMSVDKLYKHEIVPSYVPQLSEDKYDVTNFDKKFTDEDPKDSMIPESKLKMIKVFEEEFKAFNLS